MMQQPTYSLRQLVIYFLKLGTWGFGGPVALAGYMHRDLVENKKWISEEDYKEGLALAQLAPGPLAAQLGIYLGYVHYRILGATLAGLAFVLPSFLMVVALGYCYTRWQGIPLMQAVFYGVSAAVTGIISISSYKLIKKSIGPNIPLICICVVAATYTAITASESIWLFLLAGVGYWLFKHPGKLLSRNAAGVFFLPLLTDIYRSSNSGKLWDICWFYMKAGAFVFGSGLAIVPFLYSGVVKEYGWLNEQQFMDAVAVAMITPGPVVITVGFIGYLTAGLQGASVAAFATFFPCYLFTVLPAPFFRKYGKNPGIKTFVDGITAAAIGSITGAVIVLAKRSLTDLYTAAIAVVVAVLLWRVKNLPEPLVIITAAVAGIAIRYFLQ
ncbi:chromate transporter [Chitinophaga jiangningensis]|uniref:Chromate transporter n=1 Tax=Chitinophaga jiangningensis TaxID=1419482 RepID=A0A1M7KJ05_9BACT|nr:chromate transporter [Chitinophaga jiangningensis]SHM65369.1 chromate transporter [Chitinophaga jiangningensis]